MQFFLNSIKNSYKNISIAIVIVAIWFISHGQRAVMDFAVHDGIAFYTFDKWIINDQIGIGRYTEALSIILKGGGEPFIYAILSIIYLFFTTLILGKIFNYQSLIAYVLISIILIANSYVAGYYAIYRGVDSYFLYILLITSSIYLLDPQKSNLPKLLISSLLLMLAIGGTPTNIQIFFSIFFIKSIFDIKILSNPFRYICNGIIVFVLASIFHLCTYKILTIISGIDINTTSYNGISSLFLFKDFNILTLIIRTYIDFSNHYLISSLFLNSVTKFIAVFILLSSLLLTGLSIYNNIGLRSFLYFLFIILIFPLFSNCTYWLSNGVSAPHMKWYIIFIYMFCALSVIQHIEHFYQNKKQVYKYLIYSIFASIFVISFCNILWCNKFYRHLNICFENTKLVYFRIMTDIDTLIGDKDSLKNHT